MMQHKKTIRLLLITVFIMFGFTFALVPLYNVFCAVTGINGKVEISKTHKVRARSSDYAIPDRIITIEFDVTKNESMPWEFKAEHQSLKVKPGELHSTSYYAKNPTNKTMTMQAIPSITPGLSAKHLKKVQCFCFAKQTLKPGESVKMPMRFLIEPELPDNISRITLSYTLFDVTDKTPLNNPNKNHP